MLLRKFGKRNIHVRVPFFPLLNNKKKADFSRKGPSSVPISHFAITLKQKLKLLAHLVSKNEHPIAGMASTT